jgi:hypothetical protein
MDPNSSFYPFPTSTSYSGVAELMIVRSDLGGGVEECSGALLSDGISILTAAHCLADNNGVQQVTAASVTFVLPGGSYTTRVNGFQIDPLYNGGAENPNDVAVLTLAAPAPAAAARYNLYTGDTLGETVTLAGFGFGGAGATGYDPVAYPFGTLREGTNQYDTSGATGDTLFDFDDGTAEHDALGGSVDVDQAFIAPGDAGGPTFINGQIAGVHSFTARILPDGQTMDIDNVLNSSFGEYAGDASVAYNAAFLASFISATPEPKTSFVIGIVLVVIAMIGERRRQS